VSAFDENLEALSAVLVFSGVRASNRLPSDPGARSLREAGPGLRKARRSGSLVASNATSVPSLNSNGFSSRCIRVSTRPVPSSRNALIEVMRHPAVCCLSYFLTASLVSSIVSLALPLA
jgi:hypothetical protein